MQEDTISAVCTAPGEGAIGIIRISGPDSIKIAEKVFRGKHGSANIQLPPNRLRYGHIYNEAGQLLDEVLCVAMRAPFSYTAEDVVEIQCHGSQAALTEILRLTWRMGARAAEPGEFTRRAFLHGRIDLAQAEAVMSIIRARSDVALAQALYQQQGLLSQEVRLLREELKDILVNAAAVLDYPEEDIEDITIQQVAVATKVVLGKINGLLSRARVGRIIKEGLRTVIAGKPNVGKSSLLNALLGQDRAIVTDIAGTTRDTIEESVFVDGLPLVLIDTAGIRHTDNPIEKIGVEKSRNLLDKADLRLLVLDASRGLDQEDEDLLAAVKSIPHIVLLNKSDLPVIIMKEKLLAMGIKEENIIVLSVTTRFGWDAFARRLKEVAYGESGRLGEGFYIQEARHIALLTQAGQQLKEAIEAVKTDFPLDCVLTDVKNAFDSLGHITGETVTDELLKEIFARFCLGK